MPCLLGNDGSRGERSVLEHLRICKCICTANGTTRRPASVHKVSIGKNGSKEQGDAGSTKQASFAFARHRRCHHSPGSLSPGWRELKATLVCYQQVLHFSAGQEMQRRRRLSILCFEKDGVSLNGSHAVNVISPVNHFSLCLLQSGQAGHFHTLYIKVHATYIYICIHAYMSRI